MAQPSVKTYEHVGRIGEVVKRMRNFQAARGWAKAGSSRRGGCYGMLPTYSTSSVRQMNYSQLEKLGGR